MTRTTAMTAATLGILTVSALSPVFAQDGKAIVAKMSAVYSKLKTYQADVVVDQAGPQGKMNSTMSVKKSGSKSYAKIVSAAPTPLGKNLTVYSDGKTVTLYSLDTKQYMQMPMNPMVEQIAGLTPDNVVKQISKEGTFKKLADSSVNGKPVYVVEGTNPKQPTGGKVKLFIDKATSRLIKLEGSGPATGGMGGNTTMAFRNEKINAPIPASAFVFTPPKGAKPMQNPMGGGAPGGGR